MRKILLSLRASAYVLAFIWAIGILTTTAFASDGNYESNLTETTEEEINKIKEEYPDCQKYIDSVVLFYEEHGDKTDDINQDVLNAIDGIKYCNRQTEERYKEECTNFILNENKISTQTVAYDQCLANYALGIQLVKKMGAPQTAKYMEHAIVPEGSKKNPSDYISDCDSWAEQVCNSDSIMCDATEKFENEILANGKLAGTVNGTVAFNKDVDGLDLYTALHKVSYSATFSKKANGYYVHFYVTDIYDFAWNGYDNFAIGFGNNYCYAMQVAGYIRPFNIVISYIA